MTAEEWKALTEELLARWRRDIGDWREGGDPKISSLIRDGWIDVSRLLDSAPIAGDREAGIRAAIAHLRREGAALREGLTDEQDEWTAPILLDVIEKLQGMVGGEAA